MLSSAVTLRPALWNAGVKPTDFVVAVCKNLPTSAETAVPPSSVPELEPLDDLLAEEAAKAAELDAAAKAKAKAKKKPDEEEELDVPEPLDLRKLERLKSNLSKFRKFQMGLYYWEDDYVYPLAATDGSQQLSTNALRLDQTVRAALYTCGRMVPDRAV